MGFGLILAGLLFTLNPFYNVIDILPDAVGCILIIAGLKRLSDTDERFYTARRCAYILLIINTVKIPLSLIVTAFWPDATLPFTFVYGVIDTIMWIFFFSNFLSGIEYTGERHGAEKELAYCSTVTSVIYIFIIAKNLFAFLPEMTALFSDVDETSYYYSTTNSKIAQAKPYITLLSIFVIFIFGVIVANILIKYLLSLKKNSAYCRNLYEIYKKDVLSNPEILKSRAVKSALALSSVGFIFLFDFTIDAVNILPNFCAYLLIALSIYKLLPYSKKSKKVLAIPAILIVISVISYLFKTLCNIGINNILGINSSFDIVVESVNNGTAIVPATVIAVIEMLMFVILFNILVSLIKDLYGDEISFKAANFLCCTRSLFASIVYVIPLITAYYYKLAMTATSDFNQELYEIMTIQGQKYDSIHTVCGIVLIALNLLLLYVLSRKKKEVQYFLK